MKSKMISIGLALGVLVLARQASATVTVQGWWHFDGLNTGGVPTDASGHGRDYQGGFIVPVIYPGGIGAGALVSSEAAGGPLGTSGYSSTNSLRLGLEGDSDTFWQVGTNADDSYVPPSTNYIVEIWVKPQGSTNVNPLYDTIGGYWRDSANEVWIFSSGGFDVMRTPSFGWGGACVRVKHENGTITPYIQAGIVVGENSALVSDFGPHIPVVTDAWMHMALVNTNGVVSFWTNGVLCAVNTDGNETAPAGVLHLGTDGAWNAFNGYIDEERVLTFADGEFSPSLFLYTPTPRIVEQPQNITVWSNGAATFQVDVSQDPCPTYQWYLYGTNLLGGASAITADLYLDPLGMADSGKWYNCQLNCGTNTVTTANATVTVVAPNMANVNAYRNAVETTPNLESYFIVDGDTTATVHNWKVGNGDGTLQGGADYDGQTNRSFGQRAIFIKHGDGDVQIAHNDEYEFGPGGGTVEAVVYLMNSVTPEPGACATIFSVATADGSKVRYQLAVTSDGGNLVYTNDSGVRLSWGVSSNLLNRFAHVAFVFTDVTNVIAYVDGVPISTNVQAGFGTSDASDHGWIGWGPGLGSPMTNNVPAYWYGTIDELAIYTNALAATNIAIHNSIFIYGTNTSPPSIVSQTTGPKTLFTGGSPVLTLVAAGTPILNYQWYSNGVAIAGATAPTLTLHPTTAYSATYSNNVVNLYGSAGTTGIQITFQDPHVVVPNDPKVLAVMADNPTAFWRLNELAGPTAVDCAGGNDGTYNGAGVTYGVAGPPGDPETAVSFDGVAGNVVVPYTPVLNPSGPFTIEFWASPNAVGAEGPVSSMATTRNGGYEFYLGGNYGGYEFHTAAGGGYNMLTGEDMAPPLGVWAHVAAVCDGANNIYLYVNGYLVGTDNNVSESTPPFAANSSNPFYIGCRRNSTWYFNGRMSEVAFYNYALTSTQIVHHLAVGQPIKLAITAATNVIEDSNPSNPPQDGFNQRATWLASYSDGTTTRTGVMSFAATGDDRISVFGYPHLDNTNGTIMFWMCSTGVVTTAEGGGGGGYDEAALLFLWRAPGTEGGFVIGQCGGSGWHPYGAIMVQGGNSGSGGVPGTISDSLSVSDNKWHHIAITYDTSSASSPSIALYIDGAYRAGAIALRDWVWPDQNFLIQTGADDLYDGWWNNYEGKLADFRIYNKLLDATELGTAMGGGLLTTNLMLRYNFDTAPNGYVVTWPYGDLLTASSLLGPWSYPGGLTSAPPFAARSPFPVAKSTAERLGKQFFRGKQ